MATEILVFVPGTLGSELWDGNDRVWPGSVWQAMRGFDEAAYQRLVMPGLVAKDIVRSAAGGLIGIYDEWIKAFEAISRDGRTLFKENPASGTKTLYVVPYDWRLDLRTTAKVLADALDGILTRTPDADLKLVCHSMGGVLARYYLESGQFDARPAFGRISLFVTLGTPHHGAPVAYAGAVGLHKTTFLSVEQTRRLAGDARYPSLYQLFPSTTHSFIWDARPANALRNYAADEPAIVAKYALTAASLQAWRDVRAGLTGKRPANARYFFIVGSRQTTPVRFMWDGARLAPIELDDAGDGTVSLPGAMDEAMQSELVGKSHATLIDTKTTRQTLAALFGATTLFSASELATTITVTARDTAVTVDSDVYVLLEFLPEIDRFTGTLSFERAIVPEPGDDAPMRFVAFPGAPSVPIELAGSGFTYVTVKVDPIDTIGIYQPVLTRTDVNARIVGPRFAVQPA
jgi:hypothetical protein